MLGLAGVLLAALTAEFNDGVSSSALIDVRGGLGISQDPGTWLTSLFSTGQVIGMSVATFWAVTASVRHWLLGVVALTCARAVCIPLTSNLGLLYGLRTIQGLASGLTIPLLLTVALQVLPLCALAGLLVWYGVEQQPPRWERIRLGPVGGMVGQRTVEVGNYVAPGAALMVVAPLDQANYREVALRHVLPGQGVRIHADAYDLDLDGVVDSVPLASGAAFGAIQPNNATGNFTKIVQRLPVKIVVSPAQPEAKLLRLGFSVETTIHTGLANVVGEQRRTPARVSAVQRRLGNDSWEAGLGRCARAGRLHRGSEFPFARGRRAGQLGSGARGRAQPYNHQRRGPALVDTVRRPGAVVAGGAYRGAEPGFADGG